MSDLTMPNVEEFYILGIPIQTDIGKIHFIKVKDYPSYFQDLHILSMSKEEVIYKTQQTNKDGSLDDFIREIRDLTLFDLAMNWKEMRDAYINVFQKVFDSEDMIQLVTKENFDGIRKLIMKMNGIKEEEINPNPEIQRALERSRRVKSQGQDKLTIADMCSSIVSYTGKSYEEILDFTMYQFYMTFQRIGLLINYDTTSLFATVSPDVKIENWSKHIDLFEDESHTISEDQFMKTTGEVIGG